MEDLKVIEMTVKCRVPRDELEDFVIRLRRGDRLLPVPDGLRCRDAFDDSFDTMDPDIAIVRAGYR
jgi:hypothetical protein